MKKGGQFEPPHSSPQEKLPSKSPALLGLILPLKHNVYVPYREGFALGNFSRFFFRKL